MASGENLTYSVTVNNLGPVDAENVVLTDSLPPGVTLVSTSGCGEDPVSVPTCRLGTLALGGSTTFTVTVNVDSAISGLITNRTSVSSDTNDPNGGNDNVSLDT